MAELVSARADRGGGGKFLTVYPVDDEQFRRLAEALHRATAALPGPGILSDRPYRPDSLVHYRYGAFRRDERLTADGLLETMLRTPEGGFVRDLRLPRFAPPPWAPPPFPANEADGRPHPGGSSPGGSGVLLDDRYEVRSAIRYSYRGGICLAADRRTGREVVVKEARQHVGATLAGADATDLLRHEARMLDRLAEHGLCPRALGLVHQGGNLYLVQERVPGQDLRAWTAGRPGTEPDTEPATTRPTPAGPATPGRTSDEPTADGPTATGPVTTGPVTTGRIAEQLVALVRQVHALGLVLRDLSPGNVMVTPDGTLRLVDLEALAHPGDRVRRVETPGYTAPET
ncbi:hypothetical protein ACFVXQ_32650, partial [Kitasatospora sp. NPDC058263]